MIIDETNKCPKCGSVDFKGFYDVKSGEWKYSCGNTKNGCQEIWAYKNPYIGLRVKITNALSPWNGSVGRIQEIRNDKNYNVRVIFEVGKQIFGEMFNSAYLERV